jgi:hypothetical protein
MRHKIETYMERIRYFRTLFLGISYDEAPESQLTLSQAIHGSLLILGELKNINYKSLADTDKLLYLIAAAVLTCWVRITPLHVCNPTY